MNVGTRIIPVNLLICTLLDSLPLNDQRHQQSSSKVHLQSGLPENTKIRGPKIIISGNHNHRQLKLFTTLPKGFLEAARTKMTSVNGTSDSPAKEQWDELCQDVKDNLLREMGTESWYLLIVGFCRFFSLFGHRCFFSLRPSEVKMSLTWSKNERTNTWQGWRLKG